MNASYRLKAAKYPLVLLQAIEIFKLHRKPKLTIHLVGAKSEYEYSKAVALEELIHYIGIFK